MSEIEERNEPEEESESSLIAPEGAGGGVDALAPRRRDVWNLPTILSYLIMAGLLGVVGAGLGAVAGFALHNLWKGLIFFVVLLLSNGALGFIIQSVARSLFKSPPRQLLATIVGMVVPGTLVTLFFASRLGASTRSMIMGASVLIGIEVLYLLFKLIEDLRDNQAENRVRYLTRLAAECAVQNEVETGERTQREALELAERHFGSRSQPAAAAAHALANLLRNSRQFSRAEPLYLRAMPIYQEVLGNAHPELGRCLYDLALLYASQDNAEAGIPVVKRVLAIREKACGPQSLELAEALNLLANLNSKAGKDQDAVDIARRAQAIQEKHLGGSKNPSLTNSLLTQAESFRKLRKFYDAENLLKRVLEQLEGEEKPDPHRLAEVCLELGEVRLAQNKLAEAEPLYARLMTLVQNEVGPEDRMIEGMLTGYKSLVSKAPEPLPDHLKVIEVIEVLFRGERGRLRELIGYNPDVVEWQDANGWSALQWAAFVGHEDIVSSLLMGGADYRAGAGKTRTVMDVAVSWGQSKVLAELLQQDIDWNLAGVEGMTPLFWAARTGREQMIDKLIAKGADVNRRDDRGRTPLHLAAAYGQLNCAAALIAAGAQVNAADRTGQTPLHGAAGRGHTGLVECLLINGADPDLVEKEKGLSALRLAQHLGHKAAVKALKKYSKAKG